MRTEQSDSIAPEILQMPKAELHRHLELCMRPSTIRELAPQFGIDLPDDQAFLNRFVILEPMQDLGAVLNKFLDTQKLLASEEILERLAFEACEDAFKNENIHWLELRYAPTFIQQGHEHLSFEKIHQAICRGVEAAKKAYPMRVGLICILQRILPLDVTERVTNFVLEQADSFVGIDLADNEVGFDCKPFAPFFAKAKAAGLKITVHSGEANVPEAPQYVVDAIEHLGAERIGHGVQIYRSPEVMEFVRERGVTLELCPTSNWLTQAIPNLDQHPFKVLMDFGLKVTINTDDPVIFNTDLNREYQLLHEKLGLSFAQLKACSEQARASSFIRT